MVLDMHERHGNTGAVVQAYLRRTLEDVQRLVEAGIPVRLVKGLYLESREVAYRDFDIIRENYVLLLEAPLRGGIYCWGGQTGLAQPIVDEDEVEEGNRQRSGDRAVTL
jgi:hypothetical protein